MNRRVASEKSAPPDSHIGGVKHASHRSEAAVISVYGASGARVNGCGSGRSATARSRSELRDRNAPGVFRSVGAKSVSAKSASPGGEPPCLCSWRSRQARAGCRTHRARGRHDSETTTLSNKTQRSNDRRRGTRRDDNESAFLRQIFYIIKEFINDNGRIIKPGQSHMARRVGAESFPPT